MLPSLQNIDNHASPPEWSLPTESFPDCMPFCSGKNEMSGPVTLIEHTSLCWRHNYIAFDEVG